MRGSTRALVLTAALAACALTSAHADAVLFLADGRIVGYQTAPTAEAVAERMTHLADEVERQRAAGRPQAGV